MAHKINHILYTGIFISSSQLEDLKKLIPEEFKAKEGYKEIEYPHVTVFFHTNMPLPIVQYILNHNELSNFEIVVDGIGYTDKALALRVFKVICTGDSTLVPSTNKQQHITLATINDGKPVDSNTIKDWKVIDPITFTGYSRIIYKPAPKKKVVKEEQKQ